MLPAADCFQTDLHVLRFSDPGLELHTLLVAPVHISFPVQATVLLLKSLQTLWFVGMSGPL